MKEYQIAGLLGMFLGFLTGVWFKCYWCVVPYILGGWITFWVYNVLSRECYLTHT